MWVWLWLISDSSERIHQMTARVSCLCFPVGEAVRSARSLPLAVEWNRLHRFLKACSVFHRGTRWALWRAAGQTSMLSHRLLSTGACKAEWLRLSKQRAQLPTSQPGARGAPGPQRLTFTLDPWNNNYGIPLDTAACAFTAQHPAR